MLHKYPRTPHLPESPGMTSDDKVISAAGLANLENAANLLVTEKMDGGNLTMYRDAFHGRSLDSGTHHWDSRARALWAQLCYGIPEGWRVSGESLYARRSVAYEDLDSVYLVFGVWNADNELLSWADTVDFCSETGFTTVPVIAQGLNFKESREIWSVDHNTDSSEGFVIRNADSFVFEEFQENIAKWVRPDHVQTAADWRHRTDYDLNTFKS